MWKLHRKLNFPNIFRLAAIYIPAPAFKSSHHLINHLQKHWKIYEVFFLVVVPVPDTSAPSAVIAFHSYLSHDSTGPLPNHHVLLYDVVPLNRGNGYKNFDGIFNVPVTGTYVFTWSIMADAHGVSTPN